MDIALRNKVAEMEAIEQGLEGGIRFAVVLDGDPGRDSGLLRQPVHRSCFLIDEVEPVSFNDYQRGSA